eukprot:1088565-Rhodomonas_salina.3
MISQYCVLTDWNRVRARTGCELQAVDGLARRSSRSQRCPFLIFQHVSRAASQTRFGCDVCNALRSRCPTLIGVMMWAGAGKTTLLKLFVGELEQGDHKVSNDVQFFLPFQPGPCLHVLPSAVGFVAMVGLLKWSVVVSISWISADLRVLSAVGCGRLGTCGSITTFGSVHSVYWPAKILDPKPDARILGRMQPGVLSWLHPRL